MDKILGTVKTQVSEFGREDSAISGRLHSTNSNNRGEQKAGNFWKIYFFFQYVLCICPFRIAKESGQRTKSDGTVQPPQYTTQSWQPQKVICGIIDIAACIGILGELRRSLPSDSSNPTLYFVMSQTIASCCSKLLILKIYWFDEQKMRDLVNLIMSTELGKMAHNEGHILRRVIGSRYTFLVICIIYSFNEAAYTMFEMGFGEGRAAFWSNMVGEVRYNLFMHRANSTNTTWEGQSSGDLVMGILAIINFYQRFILGAFDNMFVLSAILTLWTMATSFVQIVEEEYMTGGSGPKKQEGAFILLKSQTKAQDKGCPWWPTFLDRYKSLRGACDGINLMFGTNIAFFLVKMIVFFAVAFEDLFSQLSGHGKGDWFRSALTCIVLIVICVTCILSADIEYKLFKIRKWVAQPDHRRQVPTDEIEYILDDLELSGLSIKASNTYPITFNLLANVTGTIVTYFVICVQI